MLVALRVILLGGIHTTKVMPADLLDRQCRRLRTKIKLRRGCWLQPPLTAQQWFWGGCLGSEVATVLERGPETEVEALWVACHGELGMPWIRRERLCWGCS